MARFSAADMVGARRKGEAPKPNNLVKGGQVRVAIPRGGAAEVRAADNGVIVSVRDKDYNRVSETVAVDASHVSFDKK
jgi:hypothetical protein